MHIHLHTDKYECTQTYSEREKERKPMWQCQQGESKWMFTVLLLQLSCTFEIFLNKMFRRKRKKKDAWAPTLDSLKSLVWGAAWACEFQELPGDSNIQPGSRDI